MAVSKLILKESGGGGDQCSQLGEKLEVHATKCSKETQLMFATSFEAFGY
jgi:hypothetical protein